jgi:hypothetical protein
MNIIIDPTTMNPHLKHIIPNSVYFTQESIEFSDLWNGGETKGNIYAKYNIDIDLENNIIKRICNTGKKFKNMIFTMSLLSSEQDHQGASYIRWFKMYSQLYDKYKEYVSGKIIIVDNHGGDYEPEVYLKKYNFHYDIILKRVYSNRNKQKYSNRTYPYPFIMDTNNDPMYILVGPNKNITQTDISLKSKQIFWAGSIFVYNEEWDNNNTYEHANRKLIIANIKRRYPDILSEKRVPYNIFVKTISTYKYALDIRGTSRLNKRLYEILSTNTLLLAEKIDIIWPFENNDKFSDECFFEQGNVDDLYRIYNNFENDKELYKKCLENQIYIVNKYFNSEWLWNYVKKIIL